MCPRDRDGRRLRRWMAAGDSGPNSAAARDWAPRPSEAPASSVVCAAGAVAGAAGTSRASAAACLALAFAAVDGRLPGSRPPRKPNRFPARSPAVRSLLRGASVACVRSPRSRGRRGDGPVVRSSGLGLAAPAAAVTAGLFGGTLLILAPRGGRCVLERLEGPAALSGRMRPP